MHHSKPKSESLAALILVLIMLIILNILTLLNIISITAAEILLLAATFASVIAFYQGYSWDEIQDSILEKIIQTLPGILIIIAVGFVIGTWIIGGTIPMLIYYGLKFIKPEALLVTSFILASIVSTATGTSWGSAGTVGVALIGIADASGVPLAPVAGAVICGAYFGDKISPLSDTTNLAAISSGVNVYTHIIHMLKTTMPAYLVSCILFWYFGRDLSISPDNIHEIVNTMNVLSTVFKQNIFLWVPIIFILMSSFLKKSPIPVMIISGFIAVINAVVIQEFSFSHAISAGTNGFQVSYFTPESYQIIQESPRMIDFLNRGGMNSMMHALLIMILAYSFTGVISVTGAFNLFVQKILKFVKGPASLVIVSMISAFSLGVISETYVSLIVSGELFKDIFAQFNLAPQNLSRALEDSVTGTQPFIPWTAAGIYMATVLGVPTLEYLPWAFLSYVSILFSIISAISGVGLTTISGSSKK